MTDSDGNAAFLDFAFHVLARRTRLAQRAAVNTSLPPARVSVQPHGGIRHEGVTGHTAHGRFQRQHTSMDVSLGATDSVHRHRERAEPFQSVSG